MTLVERSMIDPLEQNRCCVYGPHNFKIVAAVTNYKDIVKLNILLACHTILQNNRTSKER